MSTARYLIGDTRAVTATLPDASVDLVLTSPPFLALRSYLAPDDPAKALEIGQEPNPAAFLDVLLELTAGWRRVLAPHGSIAVELGDTYSGSGNGPDPGRHDCGDTWTRRTPGAGWPMAKSLALVPELYRIGLAYGINPLTGAPSPAGRWRVRNVVRWHRPNPPVGALGDKYRPATTDMVIACVSDRRWFDLDAVREPYSANSHARTPKDVAARERQAKTAPDGNRSTLADQNNAGAGAPPLDTWIIPTEPYPGSHYATWPRALCVKPIESMAPRRVCTTCGQPSRRIVDVAYVDSAGRPAEAKAWKSGSADGKGAHTNKSSHPLTTASTTVGWSDCGHDTWRPGVVLDPFAGSGTTLAVATGCGRDAIGIDLDHRNADLARERIGMFMETETAR